MDLSRRKAPIGGCLVPPVAVGRPAAVGGHAGPPTASLEGLDPEHAAVAHLGAGGDAQGPQ